MLFLELFLTFLLIGAFTFGGGYSMIALIQTQVVDHHHWMTSAEFADLLAVSQLTPGPIGINTATYAGYTAVLNAGHPQWAAVAGALLASLAVVAVPVALMLLLGSWLLRHSDQPRLASVMRFLRLAVIGLIAAAAIGLVGPQSFGTIGLNRRFVTSLLIFAAVFILSWRYKRSPILLILASGLVGLVIYSL